VIRCENSNYTFHGSKCYKTVLEAGKTYGEAKSGCESDGGRLAVMATPVEAIAILSSIALVSCLLWINSWIKLSINTRGLQVMLWRVRNTLETIWHFYFFIERSPYIWGVKEQIRDLFRPEHITCSCACHNVTDGSAIHQQITLPKESWEMLLIDEWPPPT
jgi:hypothetical protein